MHNLTPEFILNQLEAQESQGKFPGVVLFVDTSGFTALTAQLTEHGREGAEVLAEILLAVFEPLVESVYTHGGFIAGFAGDAFKAIFSDTKTESYLRAVAAAEQIRTHMTANSVYATQYGEFDFVVRTSIADGEITWGIWSGEVYRTEQSHAYTFSGAAIDQAIQGEDFADGGELVVTNSVYTVLERANAELLQGETLGGEAEGYIRVDSVADTLPNPEPFLPTEQPSIPDAGKFFPVDLLNMTAQGEFRPVFSIFVNVETLPEPADENSFVPTFFRLMHQYGGYLCRIGRIGANDPGGTFLLFWGAPTAHENDAERVLNFVLDLSAATTIPMRVGITWQIVYAGFIGSPLREEYTCYGLGVNLAARHMASAKWGDIFLDPKAARRAGETFELALDGYYPFKGFIKKQPVFALQRRREAEVNASPQGILVGREQELSQLHRAIQPIFHGKFGGVIVITGEAGIGKSRLLDELRQQLEREQAQGGQKRPQVDATQIRWFHCAIDEILRQSLNPFRYCLRRYFGQSNEQSEEANRASFSVHLNRLLEQVQEVGLSQELQRTYSFLGALVDLFWTDSLYTQLEPQLRFENSLSALRTFFLAESRVQPIVIQIEDLHWADIDSLHFLQRLASHIDGYPIAIVATSRQAAQSELMDVGIVQQTLHLETLDSESVVTLAESRLEGRAATALVDLLVERSEGNPFFAEQILLYLQEQNLLIEQDDGFAPADTTTLLPADAQSVMIARLDRLTRSVKEVVQAAAVLGREFEVQVLSQMLHGISNVPMSVTTAAQQAIWTELNELRYLFRHALLRDAAYEMQLRARLRVMHQTAAESIETLYANSLDSHYADLAYHYRHAGQPLQERRYVHLAGEQAAARYANADALNYFNRALELTSEAEMALRYELHLARANLYHVLAQRDEQEYELTQLEQLADLLGDDRRRAQIAICMADFAMTLGQYERTIDAAQRAVAHADQDQAMTADAHIKWGYALIWQGNLDKAEQQLEQARQLVEATQSSQEADSYHYLGFSALQRGDYPLSQRYLGRSLELYRKLDDPINEGNTLKVMGLNYLNMGDYERAPRCFQDALELARKVGFQRGEMLALGNLGHIHMYYGDHLSARYNYQLVLDIAREARDAYIESTSLNNLGLVASILGDYTNSRPYHEKALALRQSLGSRQSVAMTLRDMGLMLCLAGDSEAALRCCTESLAMTQELDAVADQGTTHYYLGRVFVQMGRMDEAKAAYQQGQEILQNTNQPQVAIEASAGLIEVAWLENRVDEVVPLLEEMLAYLEGNPIGINEPVFVYLACYRALDALDDPRAVSILTRAYNLIEERAALIDDDRLQRLYRENVSAHREVLELYTSQINASSLASDNT